jgi:hypothetical protein
VSDEIEAALRDAATRFPPPDEELKEKTRELARRRLRSERGPRGARAIVTSRRLAVVAALAFAGAAFVLGQVLTPAAEPARSTAAVLKTVDAAQPQTIWCRSALFLVYVDPEGRVTVMEYEIPPDGTPSPTGLTLAYIDAHRRALTHACAKGPAPKLRPNTLVGPWPRSVASRVLCGAGGLAHDRIQIQVRPFRSPKGGMTGNRLIAIERHQKIVDVWITAGGGGIFLDPSKCFRNRM